MISWNKSNTKGTFKSNGETHDINIKKGKGRISFDLIFNGNVINQNADKDYLVEYIEEMLVFA